MVLVRERGRAMAEAAAVTPDRHERVLGGDPDEVLATIERHGLTPANVNGAGQVVAAGTLPQLDALAADPPARARVIPLQVAGAFHTPHMAPAVDLLGRSARACPPTTRAPRCCRTATARGQRRPRGARPLVGQVSNPVRWDLCMQAFVDIGVTGVIEIPPAGTLTALPSAPTGVETLAVKTPGDLEKPALFCEGHGDPRRPRPHDLAAHRGLGHGHRPHRTVAADPRGLTPETVDRPRRHPPRLRPR